VESDTTRSGFDVVVNGIVKDIVRPGRKSVLGLAPYRIYSVSVRPVKTADLVVYDSRVERLVLFPGNIIKKSWAAHKVFIALGRIVDPQGRPIAFQRIKGTEEYTITEEDGTFQAELSGFEKLYIESSQHRCSITLPELEDVQYFAEIGDLVCH